ncbi:MAG: class I SAM-dependent methyltransferase [Lewinellaceae bacterium]|nr:class I SAM-dependent methyltransferase [Lewinellaceae bacterium]
MLLGMVYPDVVIYVNELDKGFLTHLGEKLAGNNALLNPQNLILTKGGKESTALEGRRLNKIILRNTFHHFKRKPEMLEAITRTLNPQGRLYVLETVRDINPDRRLCKLSMSQREIIDLIELNGFRLADQIELKGKLLMTFYVEN